MTRFQKVASALRGDGPGKTAADPADAMSEPGSGEEYAHATRPEDMTAVRSPDTGNGAYWDDEQEADATIPDRAPAVSSGSARDYGDEVDTEAAYASAEGAGLRPGEATDRLGDFGDIAFGNLLPDAERYTARWQQIQFRFVDDPQASVTEAADVVSQVTAKLEAAIQERQRAIEDRQRAIQERASALRGRWGEGSNADTETLRETLRMYRAFMDQLIGPTPDTVRVR
jgi:hypothetical protein